MSISSTGKIEAVLKVHDGARFRAEMRGAATSIEEVGAASKTASAEMATMNKASASGLKSMSSFGSKMSRFGRSFTRNISLPLLGIAAISGHLASNFDAAMTRIQTQAGGSAREVRVLRGEVLALAHSGTVRQGPQELAEGLYHIESVGLRGARAMDALRIAADGAAVGGSNLESTASALAGAWLTNIRGAGNLHHVMGLLNATIGAGNMRMEDLVQALGTGVLPAAKVAGLGIEDVTAALAVFTDENMQGSSAMAQFSTALHFLYAPTRKASDALESIGLKSTQLATDLRKPRGLLTALRDLHEHLGRLSKVKQERVLGEILPGGRGRVLLVLLNQLERLDRKYRQIAHTSGNFASAVARTRQTPQFRMHAALSQLSASGIELGAAILPVVVPMFQKLVGFVVRLSSAFQHMSPFARRVLLAFGGFLIILGPFITGIGMLIEGVSALATAFVFLEGVIGWPILLAAAIVAGLVLAYKKVKWFRDAVNAVWSAIKSGAEWVVHAVVAAWGWIKGAFNAVIGWIAGHWKLLLLIMGGPILFAGVMAIIHWWKQIKWVFGVVIGWIGSHWRRILEIIGWAVAPFVMFVIKNWHSIASAFGSVLGRLPHIFSTVFEAIKGAIVAAINWIIDRINEVISAYNSVAGSVPFLGGDLKVETIGHVGEPGPGAAATLPAGPSLLTHPNLLNPFPTRPHRRARARVSRAVLPIALAGVGGNVGTIETTSNIHLDRRRIAQAVGQHTADRRARRDG